MSLWGVFYIEGTHVAPCESDGEACGSHVFEETCWCSPWMTEYGVIVHRDPARGGADA